MKSTGALRQSDLLGVTNPKLEAVIANLEREAYHPEWRSANRAWSRRPRGLRASVFLIIGLLTLVVFGAPNLSRAASISVGISVGIAPPPIPVYTQPPCPAPGYMWTPGYWAYDPAGGYYWVPGTWVVAPTPGLLWTPGYWGWGGTAFIWHGGYWGPHVGFYGGINYGFGYPGVGFVGGEWRGREFFYNRSVSNLGRVHIPNVYYRAVANNYAVNRVSYNGGTGGLRARPTPAELAAEHGRHIEATSLQRQNEMGARNERAQFASANHGMPGVAATGRPGDFRGAGVVRASRAGGPANAGGYHDANPGHANSYSAGRSPNPAGAGTHQVMSARQSSSASHTYGPRPGGTTSGYSRSPSVSRNEPSRGATDRSHQASSRPAQEHGTSRPSERGRSEPHGKESPR